jgi:hypothetical protein
MTSVPADSSTGAYREPAHRTATAGATAWRGVAVFAGLLMVLVGSFNILQGLVAIFQDDFYVVANDQLLVFDVTAWGWITLLFGILLVAVGVGVFRRQTWSQVTAITLAMINALTQLAFLPAYPIWSVVIIAMDILVIYALVAHADT